MSQFQDTTIKTVVEELNHRYFLPDIQREFVWLKHQQEKKIENLFDSILRGYPIGTFLFWKLRRVDFETQADAGGDSGKLNFQLYKFVERYDERKAHNEKQNIEQVNADDLSIVLDGQQRLTSLYIGLKGSRTLKRARAWWDNPDSFEEKHLYINLRYSPDRENPDDNYQFEFRRKDFAHPADDDHYWFKVGEILTVGSIFVYARQNNLSDEEAELLDTLHRAFCTDRSISFFEETEKNLDKVLKIFIRVNSGGTKLSYSDLLMSILTANFSIDIRDQMNEFVDSLKEKGFRRMGRDAVLKTCLLLTGTDHKFLLKNFNKSAIGKIERDWKKIKDAIFSAAQLLSDFGYAHSLSSAYILSIVAYHIFRNGNIANEQEKHALDFVRAAQIKGYFGRSVDGQLERIAKIVRDQIIFADINQRLFADHDLLKISEDEISVMSENLYGHPATLPILQVLYPNLDYKNSSFHIDHIYPKSKFGKSVPDGYEGNADALYNLQLLEGAENREKAAKDPECWLNEHFSGDKAKISTYKARNYIDENFPLTWENIVNFDQMRIEKMIKRLKELLLK